MRSACCPRTIGSFRRQFEAFAPNALLLELTDDLLMLQHVRRLLRSQLNAHPIPLLALARRAHLNPPHLIVGVDDFLLPPYPADELLARVQMLLWRSSRSIPSTGCRWADW